ncbi:hypothetical protein P3T86_14030 (plasmid) [Staphylococcus nepalensis]|uniref:DUF3846 domain-containing protein n=1 Tax=Staphylococcus nepalensis TaxID=214473 RepID=UPI002B261184|nr:hypothetical protein [Staphylococcus nepalensis]WQL21598.1 hypothetical protein P3T86_14030 [Staphylococcus nepalensis]
MYNFLIYEYEKAKIKNITMDKGKDFLSFAYRSIRCEWVEYATLTSTIDIIVDEEGALKNHIYINTVYDKQTDRLHFLFGNLLFAGIDNGQTKGLSKKQIEYIEKNVIVDTIPVEIYKALK